MNINESPITHDMQDLNDFSIHEPSIRPGESVSSEAGEFEVWLRTVCFQKPPEHAYDLAKSAWSAAQSATKGKAIVSWLSLRIAHDCFEDFIRDYGKTPTDDPETRQRLMKSYDNALQDIRTALRPTSSGDAK